MVVSANANEACPEKKLNPSEDFIILIKVFISVLLLGLNLPISSFVTPVRIRTKRSNKNENQRRGSNK